MQILITGGSSLIGRATAAALVDRGHRVVTLQRSEAHIPGCRSIRGDVTDTGAVAEAMRGCSAVIHLAARVGIVGTWEQFHRTNVVGTETVLDAARTEGVGRFVHVSSPSVAHGGMALVGAAAAAADPASVRGHYSRSKAIAEGVALSHQGSGFDVVVLRPHLVWGPGDTQLVGRIVERARQGRLAFVGSGAALIDSTYLTNAADALVAAVDRCPRAGGEVLVVSNGEPRPIVDLVGGILAAHGMERPRRHVPKRLAFGLGLIAETAWERLSLDGEPPMTAFLAEQLGTAHWFDQRHTREVLAWTPRVSIDEGLGLLARSQ